MTAIGFRADGLMSYVATSSVRKAGQSTASWIGRTTMPLEALQQHRDQNAALSTLKLETDQRAEVVGNGTMMAA